MPTFLEPNINVSSPDSYNYQSVPHPAAIPENSFESTLNNISGTTNVLSFLASDGLAYANAQDPSFGGTVVSTAISNFGSPSFGLGGGPGYNGGGYTGASYSGYGYGGGQALPLTGNAGLPGGGAALGLAGGSGVTTDGFQAESVKQGILDEGLQQIILMAEVQQAARTIDAMSNILKTQHDAMMNNIRNIRS